MIEKILALLGGIVPTLLKKKPYKLWFWTGSRWMDCGNGSARRLKKYVKQAVKEGMREDFFCITSPTIRPIHKPLIEGEK